MQYELPVYFHFFKEQEFGFIRFKSLLSSCKVKNRNEIVWPHLINKFENKYRYAKSFLKQLLWTVSSWTFSIIPQYKSAFCSEQNYKISFNNQISSRMARFPIKNVLRLTRAWTARTFEREGRKRCSTLLLFEIALGGGGKTNPHLNILHRKMPHSNLNNIISNRGAGQVCENKLPPFETSNKKCKKMFLSRLKKLLSSGFESHAFLV